MVIETILSFPLSPGAIADGICAIEFPDDDAVIAKRVCQCCSNAPGFLDGARPVHTRL
jgi:hypothetical protein